jgi:uncharacterized protein YjcR
MPEQPLSDSTSLPTKPPELGRRADGRFAKGNVGGPGNPNAAHVARLRKALFEAVTEDDLKAIIQKMVEKAKEGDIAAAKEVIERLLGKPVADDFMERLDRLEALMKEGEDV